MQLIVWQGIISIHQKTFLEALAKQPRVTKVLLVVEQDITPYRKSMGWTIPQIENVEIIIAPSAGDIENIFDTYPQAFHLFGGFRVGAMMKIAQKIGTLKKARMGAISEPYASQGFKGFLRTLKYAYIGLLHFRHLDFILAIGKTGVKQYTALGFDKRYVFPWAYFINVPLVENIATTSKEKQRIIYAGRLEEAKGVFKFVTELSAFNKDKYTLDIIGEGSDEAKLKAFVAANNLQDTIHFHGFMKYDDMVKIYKNYDWVVLPSTAKDGWGVIISEGMLNGLKGICSNICGVSWAIKDGFNGMSFDWSVKDSCNSAINEMLNNNSFASPDTISSWAKEAIGADAGARYCIEILDCRYNNAARPEFPWAN